MPLKGKTQLSRITAQPPLRGIAAAVHLSCMAAASYCCGRFFSTRPFPEAEIAELQKTANEAARKAGMASQELFARMQAAGLKVEP